MVKLFECAYIMIESRFCRFKKFFLSWRLIENALERSSLLIRYEHNGLKARSFF
ncbi:hypothetical protein GBL_0253 [Geobacillus kaustophilus GBlys]|uniref:Uncharacterized protein n=1 Tax=Geobacillus kaustophilus GBlys TaxID=1337888 RepID=U2WMN6_GEOKU|nr:hypothetical protein GBL_0253 [Geobacillus kaustophilus GBlys]